MRTILLVDDDLDDHEIFAMALAEAEPSIQCSYFDSAKHAFTYLDGVAVLPNYIFLDMNMPGINGLQFLELIKASPKLSGVPVIVYSTSILPSNKDKVLEMGASHFFNKPFSFSELVQILKSLLATDVADTATVV